MNRIGLCCLHHVSLLAMVPLATLASLDAFMIIELSVKRHAEQQLLTTSFCCEASLSRLEVGYDSKIVCAVIA